MEEQKDTELDYMATKAEAVRCDVMCSAQQAGFDLDVAKCCAELVVKGFLHGWKSRKEYEKQ